ncbi:MAG TPA: ATP-binding cassette domain-containing protein [Gemmataceae bacterium]|jgi:branched-chain amino acid transport system ATP-binding protein|nr:ATP-binding cassette domain-containing protein [Gemmataceae bacterium]
MLEVRGLESGTWRRPVNLTVPEGGTVLLLGRNGAGKTTFLNTVAGLFAVRAGSVWVGGRDLTAGSAADRCRAGVRIALEGRQVFARLSVRKNLLLGRYVRCSGGDATADLNWVLGVFPALREKLDARAGDLSGGQQTQVNIGRALMGQPRVLLLDEPALGLSPQVTEQLIDALKWIQVDRRVAVVIADQGPAFVRAFPERVALMAGGEVVYDGPWERADSEGWLRRVFF